MTIVGACLTIGCIVDSNVNIHLLESYGEYSPMTGWLDLRMPLPESWGIVLNEAVLTIGIALMIVGWAGSATHYFG